MNFRENLKGKKIALMGGAGFIGHNLALKLKQLGAEPHVIDGLQINNLGYFTSGYATNLTAELSIALLNERLSLLRQAKVDIHVVDLRDYQLVTKVLNTTQPDVVVHLAAVAHANRSNKDPYSTFDHSLRTLENVLDASRSLQAHIVYLSSSMVYGDFGEESVSEDRHCDPLGIYGALKYSGEKIVIAYNQVFGTPYTIVRPSALYGERCVSRRVGQAFIENALMGKNLTVNGDGTDSLDFTYISDLVEGLLLVTVRPEAQGEIFNLTFGSGRTLNDLAEIVRGNFPNIDVICQPRDVLMPERGTLDISKARKLLGYEPKYPLEKGFALYVDWYKKMARDNPQLFGQSSID